LPGNETVWAADICGKTPAKKIAIAIRPDRPRRSHFALVQTMAPPAPDRARSFLASDNGVGRTQNSAMSVKCFEDNQSTEPKERVTSGIPKTTTNHTRILLLP
jgi:hypothetical protein